MIASGGISRSIHKAHWFCGSAGSSSKVNLSMLIRSPISEEPGKPSLGSRSYGRAEAGRRNLGTTHRNPGNGSLGRQITRCRQFVVGNERIAFVCENLELVFLSLRLSAWIANERCTDSGSLVLGAG